MTVRVIAGDALVCLRELPAESVHCAVTSPPYYGLRDYGCAGQLGLERSPEAYVAALVEVFREVRRVLRSDGTVFLNLGDSYSSGGRTSYDQDQKLPQRKSTFRPGNPDKNGGNSNRDGVGAIAGCKPKDLIGIPWMVAFALRADGWYLRRDIIWHKPNPMPESVTDRPTSAHEYLFLLTKSPTYFYDAEAIKEPFATDPRENYPGRARILGRGTQPSSLAPIGAARRDNTGGYPSNGSGRNKRTVWMIASAPYRGAHFATFPPKLVEPCILAGTSECGVCPKCRAPWERAVERKAMVIRRSERTHPMGRTRPSGTMLMPPEAVTIGWHPTCSCNAGAVPATVLDPFAGAGTTGLVAERLGRDALLIELNPSYADMARTRIASDRQAAA